MRAKEHRDIAVLALAGYTVLKYYFQKQDDPDFEFPWGDLLLNCGAGYFLASLPDWIEPATSPNHRQFFHSLTAGAAVAGAAYGKHSESLPLDRRKTVQAVALTYLVHLATDSGTAKGLPLF